VSCGFNRRANPPGPSPDLSPQEAGRGERPHFQRRARLAVYLVHYAPLVWLEYAMLDIPLFAGAKAAIVFGGVAALSYAATSAMRFIPFGARLIGEDPQAPKCARSRVAR
jgi:hypothetical protein